MIKIVDERKHCPKILASDVPLGTAFYGIMGASSGPGANSKMLLLCCFCGMMNLEDPGETWFNMHELYVFEYQPVDLEIVVKNKMNVEV